MLRKLLKYEWKNTSRMGCLMLIVLAGVTFLGWLAFQSPMWQKLTEESYYNSAAADPRGVDALNMISVFTLLFYFIMLVAVAIGTYIYLGMRFHRTMYASEGYLTHTLPVTEGQLLFAKTFVSGVWLLLVWFGILMSVFALLLSLIGAVLPAGYTMSDFWREMAAVYPEAVRQIEQELGMKLTQLFAQIAFTMLIGAFVNIVTLFGAISIGQFFAKRRVLMAVVSYIGILMLEGMLNSSIQALTLGTQVSNTAIGVGSAEWVGGYISLNSLISLVLSVAVAAVLYLISWLVNTRKLNLE